MLFYRWQTEHATPSSIEVGPCCRIADAMVVQTYVVPVHSGQPEEPPVVRPRGDTGRLGRPRTRATTRLGCWRNLRGATPAGRARKK